MASWLIDMHRTGGCETVHSMDGMCLLSDAPQAA